MQHSLLLILIICALYYHKPFEANPIAPPLFPYTFDFLSNVSMTFKHAPFYTLTIIIITTLVTLTRYELASFQCSRRNQLTIQWYVHEYDECNNCVSDTTTILHMYLQL